MDLIFSNECHTAGDAQLDLWETARAIPSDDLTRDERLVRRMVWGPDRMSAVEVAAVLDVTEFQAQAIGYAVVAMAAERLWGRLAWLEMDDGPRVMAPGVGRVGGRPAPDARGVRVPAGSSRAAGGVKIPASPGRWLRPWTHHLRLAQRPAGGLKVTNA